MIMAETIERRIQTLFNLNETHSGHVLIEDAHGQQYFDTAEQIKTYERTGRVIRLVGTLAIGGENFAARMNQDEASGLGDGTILIRPIDTPEA